MASRAEDTTASRADDATWTQGRDGKPGGVAAGTQGRDGKPGLEGEESTRVRVS